jgi:hypothetical protein
MKQVRLTAPLIVSLFLLASMVACGDDPPTRPGPITNPPPAGPTVTRLELSGPEAIPPGETAQFTATARMSDGSTRDVTREALWISLSPAVLTVNASGQVTAASMRGEAMIRAVHNAMSASRLAYSMPTGTFKLTGSVREAGFPIDGARVEILSGAGMGLSATTSSGLFRIYGVAGDTQVRVSRSDYDTVTRSLDIIGHSSLQIEMKRSRPYPGIAGNYRVTLDAACSSGTLPDEMRHRTYTAVVSQGDGPQVTVKLEGADFATNPGGTGNGFSGRIAGENLVATLASPFDGYYYYYYGFSYPSVVERISTSSFLIVSGALTVTIAGSDLASAVLTGSLYVTEGTTVNSRPTSDCRGTHPFSFARIR